MALLPGEKAVLVVVLTPIGIDVRFYLDAGKKVLDRAAECVEDTRRAGWSSV